MRHSILTMILPMFAYVTEASSGVMIGICFATLAHLVAEVTLTYFKMPSAKRFIA